MKAMIMAAGFGTRLRPLTENFPKALVPVLNKPVLERNIEYLGKYGIKDIIINAHYHADQIREFVISLENHQANLTVRTEVEILGTGGGIANCREFLKDDTFVVINSDILTNINLDTAIKNHNESGDIVTLVLHDYPRFNQIDTIGNKIKTINKTTASGRLAFTGIHVLEPSIFGLLPSKKDYADIITACYNPMIESGKPINAYIASDHFWYDIGTLESYKKANLDFLKFKSMQFLKGKNTRLDSSVILKNWAVIGNNVSIEKNAVIDSSIILDRAVIKQGSHINDSIVTP
ncbi:MAG: NDP-sugar synthase [Desulfobacteraceae bacterium]|jgi:NDP-sugar pyrophosphorylase family protein